MSHFRSRSSLILFAILLPSCGVRSLENDFTGYNKAYAAMINDQMLLNLARLDNGHPPYFMTVGAIDAKYTYASGISSSQTGSNSNTDSRTHNSTVTSGLLGLASQALVATKTAVTSTVGGVNVAQTENPNFKIIPLNDSEVAQQVLKPIPTDVFYTLYQQGYPIDLLLRIMIERIETTFPGEKSLVMQNSPVAGTAESYARFLRACAILREMQRQGVLEFEAEERFFPLSTSLPKAKKSKAKADGDAPPAADAAGTEPSLLPPLDPDGEALPDLSAAASAPTPDQMLEAKKSGYEYSDQNGAWQFGYRSRTPTFLLRDSVDKGAGAKWRRAPALAGIDQTAVNRVVRLLAEGIGVKSNVRDKSPVRTRLILRSYSRLLEAAAAEQRDFYKLMNSASFAAMVPVGQRQPIIRTRWDGCAEKLEKPLASVSYQGKQYSITDPQTPSQAFSSTRNRDAFRILVALSSQVTVDIAKFQNQVLELR